MKDKVLIGIFLISIYGMALISIFLPKQTFSENENRFLQQMPVFTKQTLFDGSFATHYELFLTDHFMLRDQWIRVKTQTERAMLKQDSNGVYFCKDSFLMEKHGEAVFTTDQALNNQDTLCRFILSVKEQFSPERLSCLIVPTASEVLTDKLPAFASPYPQKGMVDSIFETIGAKYMVDALSVLNANKDASIYYKTDHHWTIEGAFYVYQEWAKKSGFLPLEEEDFVIEAVSDSFLGTIASKVNIKLEPDTMLAYMPKKEYDYRLTYDLDQTKESLYDMDALYQRDKYKFYMGGNYGLVEIETNVSNERKLLVIKDSFGNSFVPFAVNHFEKTFMVDLRYFNVNLNEFIEEQGITDILVLYNTVNLVTDNNIWKLIP